MKKIFFLFITMITSTVTFGGCPRLLNSEVPSGTTPSTNKIAKRINQNNTDSNTIIFCKEPRPPSHTTLTYSANDFIGKTSGTDKISLGNFSGTANIGANATISNTTPIGSYSLRQQGSKVLATQPGSTWGEPAIWHFYRRIPSSNACNWNIHSSIRNYLRDHPSIFELDKGNPPPITDTAKSWSIARLNDANLKKTNGETIKADISFYWYQNKVLGGGQVFGGNWPEGGYRYCHFAVAVELQLKTNFHGSTYDINQSGTYDVNIGIEVMND